MKTGVNAPGYKEALDELTHRIIAARLGIPATRALLVGISGIDGSGKGFVSAKLADALRSQPLNVALISADDWLNLPHVSLPHHVVKSGARTPRTPKALRARCFAPALGVRRVFASLSDQLSTLNGNDPAEHFYTYAIRFDEMFERLIIPLRDKRKVDVLADCGDAKANVHRKQRYVFRNVDVVLLEGIFLFKSEHCGYFDLKIWIDCSFRTALKRAIARGQEGLPPAETVKAFGTIYFPAQRIHLARDNPRKATDVIFANDNL
jgi:uridine kinase